MASPSARSSRPQAWVWAGIDPSSKLLLATVVEDRRLSYAQLLIHAIMLTFAPGVIPLFLSDQLAHYATALLTHFGHWVVCIHKKGGEKIFLSDLENAYNKEG